MIEDYEDFTPQQKQILERFVSNTDSNVFVLRNLPEVIKGAMFSRYSRTTLGLRSLLLKEFISSEELAFESIVGSHAEGGSQAVAIQKAQSFYDRILDGYGDDSIGELGGAHLAVENISMLAAKHIEDCRIGGSPLEKSTRYVYFDQKFKGDYLFYRDPVIMTSAYKSTYIDMCNELFETYSALIPPCTELLEKRFPKEESTSPGAYRAALRAKVLDCLRGLLPASTLTNMGVYGNGRFFEGLVQKLNTSTLDELRDVGRKSFTELSKIIPSFVRRADLSHRHGSAYAEFVEETRLEKKRLTDEMTSDVADRCEPGVKLVDFDPLGPQKIAAAFLFEESDKPLSALLERVEGFTEGELERVLDGLCHARKNRRQKSPRALEHTNFTFDIVGDFGTYRDLQRHRMLTQGRQLLTCELGFYVPEDLKGTKMEREYIAAMEKARSAFNAIASELPEEAQYVVPMGYNIHWYFNCNLRALQWMCELRSQAAGHPTYRKIAQDMALAICENEPRFKRFFQFVDFDGHDLGRMAQEERLAKKRESGEVSVS